MKTVPILVTVVLIFHVGGISPASAQEECWGCTQQDCEEEEHTLGATSSDWDKIGEPGVCMPGSCSELEDCQDTFAADFGRLAEPDLTYMAEIIAEHPNRVLLNHVRNAVQVRTCDGHAVLAHLPLGRLQIAALALSRARTEPPWESTATSSRDQYGPR